MADKIKCSGINCPYQTGGMRCCQECEDCKYSIKSINPERRVCCRWMGKRGPTKDCPKRMKAEIKFLREWRKLPTTASLPEAKNDWLKGGK